jgi:hypothetical protein
MDTIKKNTEIVRFIRTERGRYDVGTSDVAL